MTKPLENIRKEYPKRGPLNQYRFQESISFNCFQCGQLKTVKLIAIYNNDWSKKFCNSCYGRLLSTYKIKTGQTEIDEKVEQLIDVLMNR